MEKRISFNDFQSIKRVALACNPIIVARNKVAKKIETLLEEFKTYETQIKALESGIVNIYGFRVEQLIKKVSVNTTDSFGNIKTDAKGNPIKTVKYLPTNNVSYDSEKKQYVIHIEEDPNTNTESVPENTDTVEENSNTSNTDFAPEDTNTVEENSDTNDNEF